MVRGDGANLAGATWKRNTDWIGQTDDVVNFGRLPIGPTNKASDAQHACTHKHKRAYLHRDSPPQKQKQKQTSRPLSLAPFAVVVVALHFIDIDAIITSHLIPIDRKQRFISYHHAALPEAHYQRRPRGR